MYPTTTIVETVTADRLRDADTARRARATPRPPAPRPARRLRALATRVALAALR
jgi:hypothetical protein